MAIFESLSYSRMHTETSSRRSERATQLFSFALDGRDDGYNEEAFQHLLAVERVRAERSDRPFLLLLVGLPRGHQPGSGVAHSGALFSALGEAVREIDVVGWYRQGRVVGAMLTQGLDELPTGAHSRIVARVKSAFRKQLPNHVADRLRVRLVQLGLNGRS